MRIYIASSYKNLRLVQLLTSILTEQGHVVLDWTELAPPIPATMTAEEAKMLLDGDERGTIFEFCSSACTSVDLLIYLGPAGQDAACEVALAAADGILIFGLAGPLEKPGLILSRLVDFWFSSTAELLQAVNLTNADKLGISAEKLAEIRASKGGWQ
ncbi:MAG: translation initiation factor 2 [Deltaproteobacteria bacterium]|jgi:hypothetical protein|nr:translation initiation factor 2 [Deltaproteobacteria bacterium]